MTLDEPLIFERGASGRCAWDDGGTDDAVLSESLVRDDDLAGLPEVGELDVLRHFLRLSQWNYSAATTMYPLGSCTMKYNPIVNEAIARLAGFTGVHPLVPEAMAQGALQVVADLEEALRAISGLQAVSLQPAAGAQGELLGMLVIRAHHLANGDARTRVLIPASAHGTNPASSALCGYGVTEIQTDERGLLAPDAVAAVMDESVAALMVTNPNTLGLFERDLEVVAKIVHRHGGLVYMDGANMNALMGVARPGDMGVDVMQFNLHKTFSTPHGGGGPGAGPIAVRDLLAVHLPGPRLTRRDGLLAWDADESIGVGRVRSFHGSFGILLRALAYVLRLGGPGLEGVTRMAVLNANYVRARLTGAYALRYDGPSMHECVFSDRTLGDKGVTTLDVAKRLLDYGFYAPTIYFPLVVRGALMIEPTETESKETLDEFCDAMLAIAEEAAREPALLRDAPHHAFRRRLDETAAARRPRLRWSPANPL